MDTMNLASPCRKCPGVAETEGECREVCEKLDTFILMLDAFEKYTVGAHHRTEKGEYSIVKPSNTHRNNHRIPISQPPRDAAPKPGGGFREHSLTFGKALYERAG